MRHIQETSPRMVRIGGLVIFHFFKELFSDVVIHVNTALTSELCQYYYEDKDC